MAHKKVCLISDRLFLWLKAAIYLTTTIHAKMDKDMLI